MVLSCELCCRKKAFVCQSSSDERVQSFSFKRESVLNLKYLSISSVALTTGSARG